MAYFNNLTVGGTTRFLQDVKWPGLKSSVDELNYLHTEKIVSDGFFIDFTTGESAAIDGFINLYSKSLGLKVGNSYTVTMIEDDGTVFTETIVAADGTSALGVSGSVYLDSYEMDDVIFIDNAHLDYATENLTSGGCCWVDLSDFSLISIKIEGEDKNGNKLTQEQLVPNTIPQRNVDLYEAHNPQVYYEEATDQITFTRENMVVADGQYFGYMPGGSLGLIPGETYTLSLLNVDTSEEESLEVVCTYWEVVSDPITEATLQVPALLYSSDIPYVADNLRIMSVGASDDCSLAATENKQDQGWIFLTGLIGTDDNVEITIYGPGIKQRLYCNTLLPASITGTANHLQGLKLTGYQLAEKLDNIVGQPGTSMGAEIFNDSDNIASDSWSHAEGLSTTASGYVSHAEGSGSVASGNYSHAEGGSHAGGYHDHAEGTSETIAYTSYTSDGSRHAEGYQCVAGSSSDNSIGAHAEGRLTTAIGLGASSHGDLTTAQGTAQAVFGRCNVIYAGQTWSYGSDDTLFIIGNGQRYSGNSSNVGTRSNAFRVTAAGDVMGTKAFTASGADYAEYYEWFDGNPNNEDRRGRFVTFAEGNKIKIANSSDDYILGVISANPSIVGNGYTDNWQGMYLTDIYGEKITKIVEVPEEKIFDEDGNLVDTKPAYSYTDFIINPDYNPDQKYIGRNERQEWGIVGTHGQLVVIDNGSCQINEYCKVANNGTAIYSEEKTEYRVVERLDDTHIRIVIK